MRATMTLLAALIMGLTSHHGFHHPSSPPAKQALLPVSTNEEASP